ncbi:MAG TPA: globin family protein [Chloroflexota bacterium]|jgi:hemoglobin-like flavoprotein
MNAEQKHWVQASFEAISPIAETVAQVFYTRLFELDPGLRPLFRGDLAVQGRALMHMLRVVVNRLDEPDQLIPMVQALGQRHAHYGVQEAHYGLVGQALLYTLEQGLGPAFTDEVRDAWAAAYALLASVMQDAAHALVATGTHAHATASRGSPTVARRLDPSGRA